VNPSPIYFQTHSFKLRPIPEGLHIYSLKIPINPATPEESNPLKAAHGNDG